MPVMKNLIVKEIFYSLQGEGARAGQASIFIRLAGCNRACAYCDTNWEDGKEMTITQIEEELLKMESSLGWTPLSISEVKVPSINWIVWTGGEPTLQLDGEIIAYFKGAGYLQAIESNGTKKIPEGIDYSVISPKIAFHALGSIHEKVNEIRYPINLMSWEEEIDHLPPIEFLPIADHYYLSPIFLGETKEELNQISLQKCIDFILHHEPRWKLSVQQHKIWKIK